MINSLHLKIVALLCLIANISFAQQSRDTMKCKSSFDSTANEQLCRSPETKAEFIGGDEAFNKYLNRHLKYDNSSVQFKTMLFFTFVVEADGSVTNVALKYPPRGVTDEIINKAFAFFKALPKFKPATCEHQNVAVRVIQPVGFLPN